MKGLALVLMPLARDVATLAPILLIFAIGSTLSGSNPKTFMSIAAPSNMRVQALAFNSTTGLPRL